MKIFHLNTECNGRDKPGDKTHIGLLADICGVINKSRFDLIGLQEVAGNIMFFDNVNDFSRKLDGFKYYQKHLKNYRGEMFKLFEVKERSNCYWGVCAFYNFKKYTLLGVERVYTHQYNKTKPIDFKNPTRTPMGFISLLLKDNKTEEKFYFITGHLTWGPISWDDSSLQRKRAKKFVNYVQQLKNPVIASFDTNVEWFTPTVTQFEKIGLLNVAKIFNISNTINPKMSKHFMRIFKTDKVTRKKGGVACDNIFLTADKYRINSVVINKQDLSDHFGLVLDADIMLKSI